MEYEESKNLGRDKDYIARSSCGPAIVQWSPMSTPAQGTFMPTKYGTYLGKLNGKGDFRRQVTMTYHSVPHTARKLSKRAIGARLGTSADGSRWVRVDGTICDWGRGDATVGICWGTIRNLEVGDLGKGYPH